MRCGAAKLHFLHTQTQTQFIKIPDPEGDRRLADTCFTCKPLIALLKQIVFPY